MNGKAGCCTTCAGTGYDPGAPETNGKCWDCYGIGHCHSADYDCPGEFKAPQESVQAEKLFFTATSPFTKTWIEDAYMKSTDLPTFSYDSQLFEKKYDSKALLEKFNWSTPTKVSLHSGTPTKLKKSKLTYDKVPVFISNEKLILMASLYGKDQVYCLINAWVKYGLLYKKIVYGGTGYIKPSKPIREKRVNIAKLLDVPGV